MNNIEENELIDSYLFDRMNMEEREEFDKRVASDPEFAGEYKSQKMIVDILQKTENDRLRARLLEADGKMPEFRLQRSSKGTKLYLAVAASVILVFGAYFLLFNYAETMEFIGDGDSEIKGEYIKKYFHPPSYQLSLRTRGDNNLMNNGEFLLAIKYYNERNYKKAGKLFRSVLDDSDQNPELIFYAAICDIATNKTNEAFGMLQQLKHNGDLLYSEQVDWYLSLLYLETGRLSGGIKNLYKILRSENLYKDSVKVVLGDIEKIIH